MVPFAGNSGGANNLDKQSQDPDQRRFRQLGLRTRPERTIPVASTKSMPVACPMCRTCQFAAKRSSPELHFKEGHTNVRGTPEHLSTLMSIALVRQVVVCNLLSPTSGLVGIEG